MLTDNFPCPARLGRGRGDHQSHASGCAPLAMVACKKSANLRNPVKASIWLLAPGYVFSPSAPECSLANICLPEASSRRQYQHFRRLGLWLADRIGPGGGGITARLGPNTSSMRTGEAPSPLSRNSLWPRPGWVPTIRVAGALAIGPFLLAMESDSAFA
jgi:hypothetical protein